MKGKKLKVTTALREPITRDLSDLFQRISKGTICADPRITFQMFHDFLESNHSQSLFDHAFEVKYRETVHFETFYSSFKENIVDILAHPFDQEKGYTIIKEGNYDIFIYQLEKLNDLVPELSDWVGVPFTELVNGNEASTKWIANSYKQAQKELKFSQEYFDLCYNDPYVQHCYSPEDIEKFKDRWRKNIDPNK